MSFYYSFTDYPLVESPLWVGLDNYKALLHDELFLKAAVKTPLSPLTPDSRSRRGFRS